MMKRGLNKNKGGRRISAGARLISSARPAFICGQSSFTAVPDTVTISIPLSAPSTS